MINLSFAATSGSTPWNFVGVEPMRAVFEYARMQMMSTASLPRGDGHPVVIFPGLASNQNSIAPLKEFCRKLGYAAYDWGLGVNTGPQGDLDIWIDQLARHVREVTAIHGKQISLVGWSLGGIYAREVAKELGGHARQVITIGTPFGGSAAQNNLAWIFGSTSGWSSVKGKELMARLRRAPEVPTVSIFSRSDGLIAWQACLHDGDQAQTEDIEVDGSHFGMGWNPEVLAIVAERLAQPISVPPPLSTIRTSTTRRRVPRSVNCRAPSSGSSGTDAPSIIR
jgi:pimeloyl-ACP methyl ester carboxylesterase